MYCLPHNITGHEKRIILFHGTSLPSSWHLIPYLRDGLLPANISGGRTMEEAPSQPDLVYLATFDDPYKENFARKRAGSEYGQTTTGKQIALRKGYAFEVEVATDNLVPDEDTHEFTWQRSLSSCFGTCAHRGPISPVNINALRIRNYDGSFTRMPRNEIRGYIIEDMKRQFDTMMSMSDDEIKIFNTDNERLVLGSPQSRSNFFGLSGYPYIGNEGYEKIDKRKMTKEECLRGLKEHREVALKKGYCGGSPEDLEDVIREIEQWHT